MKNHHIAEIEVNNPVTIKPLAKLNSDVNVLVGQYKELQTNDLFDKSDRKDLSKYYLNNLKNTVNLLLNEVELHIQELND